MVQPPVTDHRAIIDALRRHGSVHYPRTAVPGEFTVWRRRLRQVARAAQVRISVTRGVDYLLVENLDYEVSVEDSRALTDVIEGHILGRDLSFDDAVHARRRQRIRLAPPPQEGNGPGTGSDMRAGLTRFGWSNWFSVLFFGDWSGLVSSTNAVDPWSMVRPRRDTTPTGRSRS